MVKLSEVEGLFWGACVEAGKKFSMVAEKNICITMASVDPSHCKGTEPITLYQKKDEVEYVICSLVPGSLYQQQLDLMFEMGEELSLVTKGNGSVHLTGYFIEEDTMPENPYDFDSEEEEDFEDMEGEEEFDSDDEMNLMEMDDGSDDDSEEEVIVQGKRKKEQKAPEAKKVKFQVELNKPTAKKNDNKQNNQKPNEQKKNEQKKNEQKKDGQKNQQEQKKVPESPAGENKKKNKKKNKKNKNKNNKAN